MARRLMRFAVAALAFAALAGCLNSADQKKVDAVTQTFFSELRAKQYDAIYAAAAPELTSSITKENFEAYLANVDAAMGACQPPTKAPSISFNTTNGVYLQTQGWNAACANGVLYMKVTVVLRGGVAKLAGFQTSDKPISDNSAELPNANETAAPAANAAPADNASE